MLIEVRICYSLIVSPFQHAALPCPGGSKRDSVARLRAERSGVRFPKGKNVQNGFRAYVVSTGSSIPLRTAAVILDDLWQQLPAVDNSHHLVPRLRTSGDKLLLT